VKCNARDVTSLPGSKVTTNKIIAFRRPTQGKEWLIVGFGRKVLMLYIINKMKGVKV